MFDFLVRETSVNQAQKFIDHLTPKVNVHVPKDIPLPSVSIIKRMCAVVAKINALEPQISQLLDAQLKDKTNQFRLKIQHAVSPAQEELKRVETLLRKALPEERENLTNEINNASEALSKARENILKEILPEAFGVVREVGRRVVNMRHFDTQLVGGMVLHEGRIAEMATGEGKTLVATLPVYLNALVGQGVHVVTVNDYLARRDREWMGPVYEFLGLTVGVIQHDIPPSARQEAYACDITYGTNNEFGFDYLRDNMVTFKEEMVQRGHHYAVVDEVDSILIDEARTPLIISGPAEESTDKYYTANNISKQLTGRRITEKEEIDAKHKGEDLTKGFDYVADEKSKAISLTEQGEEKSARLFGVKNLHEMETIEYRHHVLQALRAKEFFHVDVDYVIRDGKVIIVDEFTGRMMPGRRWSDGLHQAVEAKEGIKIERENQTLATITFQNYFRMYEKLAGMTGTAYTEANEFKQIYELDCVVIPSNKILIRKNHPDCIYKTEREKFSAVVEEIAQLHQQGQPVLVGTVSIEKSEFLSELLKRRGVTHQVLNAKYHDLEAQIVAQAGRHKAVTIATNMAGRGTDILLGGNAEFLAKNLLKQKAKEDEDAPEQQKKYTEFLTQFRKQVQEEHEKVVQAGGLHVLGTSRHESRRIDNQLRGRSGRQGDPGSSRFYVSLQDELMRLFGSDRIMMIMDKLGMEEGQVIEHPLVSRAIEVAQKRVENHNFEIRKHLLDFDNVMNKQREVIYTLRRSILEGEGTKEIILDGINDFVAGKVQQFLSSETGEANWDAEGLILLLKTNFGLDISSKREEFSTMSQEQIKDFVLNALLEMYEQKEKAIGTEQIRYLERMIILQNIDTKWKDHLYAMDQLKEGINLRAYGQRDPLVEYQREAFNMFQAMHASIYEEVVETVFKVQAVNEKEKPRGVFSSIPQQFVHNEFTSLSQVASQFAPGSGEGAGDKEQASAPDPYHKPTAKVGRNDPCPCGSGKKYKKCCGS